MKLDFPVVLEELTKVKDTGFSQYGFIQGLYMFIGKGNAKYQIEIRNIEIHASDIKRRKIQVHKRAKEGAFDKRIIADMPAHIQTKVIPNLKVEKCETLVERLLKIIDSDEGIGALARERMQLAAKDRSKLHIFLAEVILYTLQHSRDKKGNSQKTQNKIDQDTNNSTEKLVSNLILPVSGANYISRPKAEEDILDSLQHHKITVIRALSGYGKSELARHVATLDERFPTKIQLVLAPDGSGIFDNLVDTQIGITPIPQNEDLLKRKKDLLKKAGPETIIVIDNFNDYENEAFLKQLSESTGDAAILVTSQLVPSALENIFLAKEIDGNVIDVEDEGKYPNAAFAQRVFCKYADFSYDELSSTKKEIVTGICEQIANHTMIAAALGRRAFEYGDTLEDLLEALHASVRNCLSEELSVQLPKDRSYNVIHRTPYEILKTLFTGNVLAHAFTDRERQILGAIVLLPVEYHTRNILEELVGDLREAKAGQAKSATSTLIDANIISTVGPANTPEEKLQVHPLYIQLLSDPNIFFHNKTGEELKGPIAEVTPAFAFHLLNNMFVSDNLFKWNNCLRNYRKLITNIHLVDMSDLHSVPIKHAGWLSVFSNTNQTAILELIQLAVNKNHSDMNIAADVTMVELRDLMQDMGVSSEDGERTSTGFALDDYELWSHPNHPGIIFVTEGEHGRSLWLLDYNTKKEICLLNLSEQRLFTQRYFNPNRDACPQNGRMLWARMLGFWGGWLPKYLYVPDTVFGVNVYSIHGGGHRSDSLPTSPEIICIPSTIQEIDTFTFLDIDGGPCKYLVFLGDNLHIKEGAFCGIPESGINLAILPEGHLEVGHQSFGAYGRLLDHIVIPVGAHLCVHYEDIDLLRLSVELGDRRCIPIKCNNTLLYYDTAEVIKALFEDFFEQGTKKIIYDITNTVSLDWDLLLGMLQEIEHPDCPLHILDMKLGEDFVVAQDYSIIYSDKIVAQYPLIKHSIMHRISSFPAGCRLYTMGIDPTAKDVYADDIAFVLQYCVQSVKECISDNNLIDAMAVLQIAESLIAHKKHIFTCDIFSQVSSELWYLRNLLH